MHKKKFLHIVFIILVLIFAVNFRQRQIFKKNDRAEREIGPRANAQSRRLIQRAPLVRYRTDQILVKFKPHVSLQSIESAMNAYQTNTIRQIPLLNVYQIQIPDNMTVEEMVYIMSINPDVEYAEPNYIFRLTEEPNDFYFEYQYGLLNRGTRVAPIDVPGAPTGKSDADIKAVPAWDETKGLDTVTIAILDTGVDLEHPDIDDKIASPGKDFVNGDDNADDDEGHGTFVAGIAAAETDNSIGVAGAAWNCKILPVKVFDKFGETDSVWISEGIIWAADQGADVINMSFGGSIGFGQNISQTVEDSLEYAYNYDRGESEGKGVVLVASSGNDGVEGVLYPATSEFVLAVGATDSQDQLTDFSTYGEELDVAAPGEWIWSIFPVDLTPPGYDFYGWGDGTSFSAPFVAGLAAMIKSIKPWLDVEEIMNVIRYTADDVNSDEHSGKDIYLGYGRINMEKALAPNIIEADKTR
jgi:subtilisin family serine protease